MALRKQNKKRKNSNIGSSFLPPESHVGDKEYFSFWSKTGLFDDPNIAELFAMIEEAKRNTVVPEIPSKRMKKETVKDDRGLCVPMNGNEVAKNNGDGDDDDYCERKTEARIGDQNIVMPEIPTKRMKIETVEDQSLYVSMKDNEVAKNNGDGGDDDSCERRTVTIIGNENLCVPMNDNEVSNKNGDDNADWGNADYCDTKTEQIVDHAISVPKGQKSIDVIRTSDEKDQNNSIVNLKPDKKRHFSTATLKYFSVVSELNRDVCQRALDYLSKYKSMNNLQKFFTVIEKEENAESKSQKGDILFKREGQ